MRLKPEPLDAGARHVEVIFFSGNEGQLTVSTKCFSSENGRESEWSRNSSFDIM
jgi:hypothetical protein